MKSTIRLSLFLLLLTQIVFGQTRTVLKDAFVQSRDDHNDTIPVSFSSNKKLYPPRIASLLKTKNALYEIKKGNKIKFYVFEGMSIDQKLIASLSSKTQKKNTVTESNDIYLDQNTYGVRVLRSGEYEYKTYIFSVTQRITTFEAILDVIPRDNYYFDFPGKNTLPYKDCYDTTQVNGKKAILTFQTNGVNEPVVEWLKSEKTYNMPRIKQTDSVWSFDLRHSLKEKNRIEQDSKAQLFFYKLKDIDTIFRLKIGIGFGCKDKSTTKASQTIPSSIVIPPDAKPFKQPNTTGVDVYPPN